MRLVVGTSWKIKRITWSFFYLRTYSYSKKKNSFAHPYGCNNVIRRRRSSWSADPRLDPLVHFLFFIYIIATAICNCSVDMIPPFRLGSSLFLPCTPHRTNVNAQYNTTEYRPYTMEIIDEYVFQNDKSNTLSWRNDCAVPIFSEKKKKKRLETSIVIFGRAWHLFFFSPANPRVVCARQRVRVLHVNRER